MSKQIRIHCTNCTPRHDTLVKGYHSVIVSERGINLCPRCKCPEVMLDTKDYSEELLKGLNAFEKHDSIDMKKLLK